MPAKIDDLSHDEILELYVHLKQAELLISWYGWGALPEHYKRLLEDLGVSDALELDRLVHRLHVLITNKNPPDEATAKASGDAEYILEILEYLGVSVWKAEGDGYREPAVYGLDNGMATVKLAPTGREAEVLIDADLRIHPMDFAERYLRGPFESDVVVYLTGSTLMVKGKTPEAIERLHRIIESEVFGPELADSWVLDIKKTREGLAVQLESLDYAVEYSEYLRMAYNAESLLENLEFGAYNIREIVGWDTIPEEFLTLVQAIEVYSMHLTHYGVTINKEIGSEIKVHVHPDALHIHGQIRVDVSSKGPVYPVVAGLLSLLDREYPLYLSDQIFASVAGIVEKIAPMLEMKTKTKSEKLQESQTA